MFLLSPAKLLVILVVALVVLGPDKLPAMAKKVGALWSDFRAFRDKLESGVRGTFPDLPSTETITQAVRSPLSFLDSLAGDQDRDQTGAAGPGDQPETGGTSVSGPEPTVGQGAVSVVSPGTAAASADRPGATDQPASSVTFQAAPTRAFHGLRPVAAQDADRSELN